MIELFLQCIFELVIVVVDFLIQAFCAQSTSIRHNRIKRKKSKFDLFRLITFIVSFVLLLTGLIIYLANRSAKVVYIPLFGIGGVGALIIIILRLITMIKYIKNYLKEATKKERVFLMINTIAGACFLATVISISKIGSSCYDSLSDRMLKSLEISFYIFLAAFVISFVANIVVLIKCDNRQRKIIAQLAKSEIESEKALENDNI